MTVQLVQARSVVAVHSALCFSPSGQAPEQGWQPFTPANEPLAQPASALASTEALPSVCIAASLPWSVALQLARRNATPKKNVPWMLSPRACFATENISSTLS